jgi:hypothetical protein
VAAGASAAGGVAAGGFVAGAGSVVVVGVAGGVVVPREDRYQITAPASKTATMMPMVMPLPLDRVVLLTVFLELSRGSYVNSTSMT